MGSTPRRASVLGAGRGLKTAEDTTNSVYQRMQARFVNVASRADEAASFLRPEILAIPVARMKQFLSQRLLAPYRLMLERLVRFKPHTLSRREERLLAMQTEMAQAAGQTFRQLHDADLKFGSVKDEKHDWVELSHGTYSTLLHSPKREVRRPMTRSRRTTGTPSSSRSRTCESVGSSLWRVSALLAAPRPRPSGRWCCRRT